MFTLDELNQLFNIVIERPYKEVAGLISKLQVVAKTYVEQNQAAMLNPQDQAIAPNSPPLNAGVPVIDNGTTAG